MKTQYSLNIEYWKFNNYSIFNKYFFSSKVVKYVSNKN